MRLVLSIDTNVHELMDYLERHESDIAYGINDFADLIGLFVAAFKRQPEK